MEFTTTVPMKGRDIKSELRTASDKLIKTLPLEDDLEVKSFSISKPRILRTALQESKVVDRKKDGMYAMKFKDSTWAHSYPDPKDHLVTTNELMHLETVYDENIKLAEGYPELERTEHLQAAVDLLLDELINQLSVSNSRQSNLLLKARKEYASIFTILQKDVKETRKLNGELQNYAEAAINERDEIKRRTEEKLKEMADNYKQELRAHEEKAVEKQMEYDASMHRFVMQKQQLEDHVKALHKVFLDFQSDSVYITLEDLKQKLETANRKLIQKEDEVEKLTTVIDKWKLSTSEKDKEINRLQYENKNLIEQNKHMTQKNVQLVRRNDILEMQVKSLKPIEDDGEEEESNEPAKPLISPEQSMRIQRQRKVNMLPFIKIFDSIHGISVSLASSIEKLTGKPYQFEDNVEETAVLSAGIREVQKVIESKLENLKTLAESVSDIQPVKSKIQSVEYTNTFQDLFSRGIIGKVTKKLHVIEIEREIHEIYTAKYYHDQLQRRAHQRTLKLSDFVLMYYYHTYESMPEALTMCKRLYKIIKVDKSPNVRLFWRFITEAMTTDELSFFISARYALIGNKNKDSIPVEEAKSLIHSMYGSISPMAQSLREMTDEKSKDGTIDVTDFLSLFLSYYKDERHKRRDAVKLIFQSRGIGEDGNEPTFEVIFGILVLLGYKGSFESIIELYRESFDFSRGAVTVDGFLSAMDSLCIHFYTIEAPIVKESPVGITKEEMCRHWDAFQQMFIGIDSKYNNQWIKSDLSVRLTRVQQSINLPVSTFFNEYRSLLDAFQYSLILISQGSETDGITAERQLELLESLNSLLVDSIKPLFAK